ncbi:MAG: hypothetical protein IJX47_06130 [Clostridia bacterium]|nr:hypothetical protein [Clostridia bacterium]
MKYIYLIRTDNHFDESGKLRTLYGIDVWRLPDRDARLYCSYPALFADRARAEKLAQTLTETKPSPESLSEIIEAARTKAPSD